MLKTPKIFEQLEIFASIVPAPFYWADVNCVVLGFNHSCIDLVHNLITEGYDSNLIGKDAFSIYTPESAQIVHEHSQMVMQAKTPLAFEEKLVDLITGTTRYYISARAPLFENGIVVGIVGTITEITAKKEAELLKKENELQKIENERHKTILKEQNKFKKIIGQIVHDIQSPLSSLQTIVQAAVNIPENDRVNLRNIAMSITDITTQMLNTYQDNLKSENEQKQSLLLSANLLQILSEKRYEYKNVTVEFAHDFEDNSYFTFIKIEPSSFKRMVSNTINNAVDAVKNKKDGKVTIKLHVNSEWVEVSIEDNGKGMPKEILDKVNNKIAVTSGKEKGHGIGLSQVRDTLEANYGKLDVESTLGIGTKVKLMFPKIVSPSWVAQEIKVFKDDIIVILDDDNSIHGAWNTRLANIINESPNIQVKHFIDGIEAINFINSFTELEKQKICLLSDYELLKQSVNGLDVIKQTQLKRSTLVTSYYNDVEIRNIANKDNIKVLPKSLAFAVPINLTTIVLPCSKKVDMVWIDDAKEFVDSLVRQHYKHLDIDKYYDPFLFMDNYRQYPLDTRIILDMFYYEDITLVKDGLSMAKELHENGYTNLFIATGEIISQDKIPYYLKLILKNDSKNMSQLNVLENIYHVSKDDSTAQSQKKAIDLIVIDDNKSFINTLLCYTFQGMQVDTYLNPEEFLENISQYDKNTKIAIDNCYENSNLKGSDIAQKLYNDGFTNLYILSGNNPEDIDCASYVTAIKKTDLESIKNHLAS